MEKWIKEFPSVEGFYWMRREGLTAEPVDVWRDQGEWFVYRLGSNSDVKSASLESFEFLGPITPPKE